MVLALAPWIVPRGAKWSLAVAVHAPCRKAVPPVISGDVRSPHQTRAAALRHPRCRRPRPAVAKLPAQAGSNLPLRLAACSGMKLRCTRGAPDHGGGRRARDSVGEEEPDGPGGADPMPRSAWSCCPVESAESGAGFV